MAAPGLCVEGHRAVPKLTGSLSVTGQGPRSRGWGHCLAWSGGCCLGLTPSPSAHPFGHQGEASRQKSSWTGGDLTAALSCSPLPAEQHWGS